MSDKPTKPQEKEVETLNIKDSTLVFISHDSRDAQIAEAFSKLLSSVSAGVLKSFRSSDNKGNQGIEYGVEWYPKIIDSLQNASDVVCLLTDNSINRPWILFEAGMAKGKLNTPILGIAIGVPLSKISTGPFAQFQNCDDDENALTKLVKQLVNKIPNSEPDEDVIRFQVQQFKKKVGELLNAKPESKKEESKEPKLDSNAAAKLFEEVKIMFKELPIIIERVSLKSSSKEPRKLMHPGMLEELAYYSMRFDSKIGLQIILSPIKNDFPWIYDGAIDTLEKVAKAKTAETVDNEISKFMRIVEFTFEHPKMRETIVDNEYNYRNTREIPRLIYDFLRRSAENKTTANKQYSQ
jgi:hypothetical protein